MKKTFKILTGIVIGVTVFIALSVIAINLYVSGISKKQMMVSTTFTEEVFDGSHDCIIVLGAGLRNGEPSPMLKDRLEKGIALYNAGVAPKLLMSGDHGHSHYNEVQVMKQYAIDAGVPSEDIFMDHAGFSTYETMVRAQDVFDVKAPVIVTQEYHLYRSVYIASKLDLNCLGVSTDPRTYGGETKRAIREYAARCKDVATVFLHLPPTYGGDKIPISGNGNLTNDSLFE